ncbi:hypothetical protein GGI21_006258, partial [Coemansia aciculifera]
MEPTNLYVFHQGDGVLTPKQKYLFVYPISEESLAKDVVMDFAISVLKKTNKHNRVNLPGPWNYLVIASVLKQHEEGRSDEKNTGGRAILTARMYRHWSSFHKYLYLRSSSRDDNRDMPHCHLLLMKSNMDKLIEIYQTATADKSVPKMNATLASKGIYVCDARKTGDPYAFDKRSDEEKAFIQETKATKQTHKANDKQRRTKYIER